MTNRIFIGNGDVFSRLTFVSECPPVNRQRYGIFTCICGKAKRLRLYDVVGGKTQSCGCYHRQRVLESNTIHGQSNTSEYHAWWDMIERCRNPTCEAYSFYGGRGIEVFDAWVNDFNMFISHIGHKTCEDHELDRIDNNDGYFPGNVRWTTRSVNMSNTRRSVSYKIGNVVYPSAKDAAIAEGVSKGTVMNWCHGFYKNSKRSDCNVIKKY